MPGFPSNDFEQGPKNGKEVADFCYNTYDVKFSMFAKSSVKGTQANPLHALLVKLTGTEPKWNFYKYLIDRNNKVAGSYSSKVTMTDSQLVVDIEKSLAQ